MLPLTTSVLGGPKPTAVHILYTALSVVVVRSPQKQITKPETLTTQRVKWRAAIKVVVFISSKLSFHSEEKQFFILLLLSIILLLLRATELLLVTPLQTRFALIFSLAFLSV